MPLNQNQVEQMLDKATTQSHVFHGKVLVVAYRLESGYVLIGVGASHDIERFNISIGEESARRDVETQLSNLESYRQQQNQFLASVADG